MNVEDLKQKKRIMEQEIAKLVKQFQNDTDIKIKKIDITTIWGNYGFAITGVNSNDDVHIHTEMRL